MLMFLNGARILFAAVILAVALSAQTFTTLYNFGSFEYDGKSPSASVILAPRGELYGTTPYGGERGGRGTVYELLPPASPGGAWSEVVLHSFNGTDGEYPEAALLMGPNGALYGVATISPNRSGATFELDPPTGGSTHWPYTVTYRFPDGSRGSPIPSGPLVFGTGGSLYGNTQTPNGGTVYSLTPPSAAGAAWIETTLYRYSNLLNIYPTDKLAVGRNGTLFGVTARGGRLIAECNSGYGCGTVFSLTPPAASGGAWTKRILYAFNPEIGDGKYPIGGVVLAPTGVLYGTTFGGNGGSGSSGTVFSLTPSAVTGEPMTETILYSFTGSDGAAPASSLVLAPDGVLYGTTSQGGGNNVGTVFELVPPTSAAGSWTETILHSFTGSPDGAGPNGLALGPDGMLYGTTYNGGAFTFGTVFSVTP